MLKIIVALCLVFYCSIRPLVSQNKVIERFGDTFLIVLPTATLATTFIMNDKKGSWQFAKSLVLTGVLTYGLKFIVNKERPDMSNDNSFPSGHTSTTFQSASFIHTRYGLKYSVPVYALAGFTAFSRIDAEKHDILDIIAGAVIGIGSSYLFTTKYKKEHMALTFNRNKGQYVFGLNYKF